MTLPAWYSSLNAVVGFREEYQAGSVIEALKKTLALSALAKRDGA